MYSTFSFVKGRELVKVSIFLVMTLFSTIGFAGHENGSGGGGFLCTDRLGNEFVEMAEIWEAKNLWNLRLIETPGKTNLMYRRTYFYALKKLALLTSRDLANDVNMIASLHEKRFWSPQGRLEPPKDAQLTKIPQNCKFVGVFSYFDKDNSLFIDGKNYGLLRNATNIAAGKLHEGIYWYMRRHHHHKNSVATRKLVACILSLGECPHINWEKDFPGLIRKIN